jgi:hypothetical protein
VQSYASNAMRQRLSLSFSWLRPKVANMIVGGLLEICGLTWTGREEWRACSSFVTLTARKYDAH